jgi:hypothetical protein
VGEQEALHRVLSLAGAGEQELRAAADNGHSMPEEFLEHLFEREDPRFAIDQREQDDRDRVLQRRELVELVQHDVGVGVALQLDDQADRLLEIAFVPNLRDAGDFAFIGQRGNLLHDGVARLLVGDFVDDDPRPLAAVVDGGASADDDGAAAGHVTAANAGAAGDDAAGGEVGSRDVLDQVADRDGRVIHECDKSAADFGEVVGRDAGGHAHGDAAGTIHQQVGKP